MGADIVVGEGQSIGNALTFGGPYVGLFATRRNICARCPAASAARPSTPTGKRGFVLTLSTREQHIRRDKATSNICTNSGLCALAFTIHMTLLGEAGLTRLARVNHANAVKLADVLAGVPGVEVLNESFFNEFTLRVQGDAAALVERWRRSGVLGGVPVSRLLPRRRARRSAHRRQHRSQHATKTAPRFVAALEGGAVMLNRQGRPTAAGDAGDAAHRDLHRQSRRSIRKSR